MRLNFGCGRNRLEGYVNVDKEPACRPDIGLDLEQTPWPYWDDDSIEEIRLTHVLEHLGQETAVFLNIMRELYRVLKPYGQVHIRVPHPRSDAFIGDPTHVRPITPPMLDLFSQRLNRQWEQEGWANTPLGVYLGVNFEVIKSEYKLTPRWSIDKANGHITDDDVAFAIETYSNVVAEIYMILQKVPL